MSTKLSPVKTQPTPSTLQGQYAGFISRFLAFLIDIIVVIVTVTVVGSITTLILNFFGVSNLIDQLRASIEINSSILRIIAAAWGVTTISFLYFVIFWTVTSGKSIGKGLIGLRIVPMDGSRITLLRSIWRYLTFWVAVLALALGVLWILVSDRRQGWHDKFANTCVIYDWPAREDILITENLKNRMIYLRNTRTRLRRKRPQDKEIEST